MAGVTGVITSGGYDEFYEPIDAFGADTAKYQCPACGGMTKGVMQQKYRGISFFAIPCKRYKIDEPRMFCGWCFSNFSGMRHDDCKRCGVVMLYHSNYCVNCGYKKRSNDKIIHFESSTIDDDNSNDENSSIEQNQ
ncbi:hypothetical protein HERIO_179 [Hepatospora eriocheir]|uniref:Zinc-ribbon 15 domain-containing protein n=1 Tax=Hepatospora eriocheir TaxID=1081669 RepID=A0A1X0QDX0_9MICR|nr:hypothetical protein HERIO_179 [Hepatospora eriocheir]